MNPKPFSQVNLKGRANNQWPGKINLSVDSAVSITVGHVPLRPYDAIDVVQWGIG